MPFLEALTANHGTVYLNGSYITAASNGDLFRVWVGHESRPVSVTLGHGPSIPETTRERLTLAEAEILWAKELQRREAETSAESYKLAAETYLDSLPLKLGEFWRDSSLAWLGFWSSTDKFIPVPQIAVLENWCPIQMQDWLEQSQPQPAPVDATAFANWLEQFPSQLLGLRREGANLLDASSNVVLSIPQSALKEDWGIVELRAAIRIALKL